MMLGARGNCCGIYVVNALESLWGASARGSMVAYTHARNERVPAHFPRVNFLFHFFFFFRSKVIINI